jgi:hypothetical protein
MGPPKIVDLVTDAKVRPQARDKIRGLRPPVVHARSGPSRACAPSSLVHLEDPNQTVRAAQPLLQIHFQVAQGVA